MNMSPMRSSPSRYARLAIQHGHVPSAKFWERMTANGLKLISEVAKLHKERRSKN
jgi:hypothetical protein